MTPTSPPDGPHDPAGLAGLAADERQSLEVRQRAFEGLVPAIQRVARRLAVRFLGQQRQDLVENAPGDIWEAIGQFPRDGRFEPWCYVVLRNRRLKELLHEQRERKHTGELGRQKPESADLRAALERAWDRPEPLADGDVQRLNDWPLRYRIVLLSLSGLWTKVHRATWDSWVSEYRVLHGVPPTGPFPPRELDASDQIAERNALLARLLNVRRNTLSVWLWRGKALLLELRYVRELLETPGEGHQP